jgi:hypothetical protein
VNLQWGALSLSRRKRDALFESLCQQILFPRILLAPGPSREGHAVRNEGISRSHYKTIATNRSYFGSFDPFGDFDLLFGADRLNLRILDVPVRYQERTYGKTNVRRWSRARSG